MHNCNRAGQAPHLYLCLPHLLEWLEDPEHAPDPDIFELVGVIVHHGSLAFGHYWSHVRLPNASYPFWHQWSTLEDNRYCLRGGGLQEIQEQCFGGSGATGGHCYHTA